MAVSRTVDPDLRVDVLAHLGAFANVTYRHMRATRGRATRWLGGAGSGARRDTAHFSPRFIRRVINIRLDHTSRALARLGVLGEPPGPAEPHEGGGVEAGHGLSTYRPSPGWARAGPSSSTRRSFVRLRLAADAGLATAGLALPYERNCRSSVGEVGEMLSWSTTLEALHSGVPECGDLRLLSPQPVPL